MTKRFKYTFFKAVKGEDGAIDHYDEITLKKTVTDRMEERDHWKKVYAANYFQRKIRKEYYKNFTVYSKFIEEC